MQGRMRIARPLVTLACVIGSTAIALAIDDGFGFGVGRFIRFGVPTANQRVGSPDNVIAPGFKLVRIAQGTDPLENPSGAITRAASSRLRRAGRRRSARSMACSARAATRAFIRTITGI
jgi:hypothetical protein